MEPSITETQNRNFIAVGLVCTIVFIGLFFVLSDFVLDDSYITYRYSQNLADGHGLVWNVGDDPVEGFTSFLWVILNAGAILCKIDPVVFSKAISLVASLVCIWMLVCIGRRLHWTLLLIFTSSLGFNAYNAFISTQGMETAIVCMLVTLLGYVGIRLMERRSFTAVFVWYVLAFLSALGRPDTAPFTFGVFVSLLAWMLYTRSWALLRKMLVMGVVFGVLGAVYMLLRYNYFGYLFPNAFYIKTHDSGGFLKAMSRGLNPYTAGFITSVMLPYLFIMAFLFGRDFNKGNFYKTVPIFVGCLLFGLFFQTVNPIQGFLGRFLMPCYSVFMLAVVYCVKDFKSLDFKRAMPVLIIVLIIIVGWDMQLLNTAFDKKIVHSSIDRVKVGKALAGTNGRLLTTESGAVPFYSGWNSIDSLGLNSEEISHHGFNIEVLRKYKPDMYMCLYKEIKSYSLPYGQNKPSFDYMLETGFTVVAATKKRHGIYHYYFLRSDYENFDEVAERLTSIDGVEYGDLNKIVKSKDIPVYQKRTK